MKATVACPFCGCRNRLAREIYSPQKVYVICIRCERRLTAVVTAERLGLPVTSRR